MTSDSAFGFRDLTVANFLTPDPDSAILVLLDRNTGEQRSLTAEDWAAEILAIELSVAVPHDLQKQFIIARAPLLYGYFFYPIYAVGMGLMFMFAEAAVSTAALRAGANSRATRTFEQCVDWLGSAGLISGDHVGRWHLMRELRNNFAHRMVPATMIQTIVLESVEMVADEVGQLFASVSKRHGLS